MAYPVGQSPTSKSVTTSASDWAQIVGQGMGTGQPAGIPYQNVTPSTGLAPKPTTTSTIPGSVPGNVGAAWDIYNTLVYGSGVAQQQAAGQLGGQTLAEQLQTNQYMQQNQQSALTSNWGYTQQQQAVTAQQQALAGQQLGQQSAYNTLLNTLAQGGFGLQQQQLGLSEKQAQQSMAASGTLGTGTAGQTAQQFAIQQGQLNLSEQQQQAQYGYSQQQVQNGLKQLALQNQSIGISNAQAKTQYQNAMQQLGLSGQMTVEDFEQQLAAMIGGGYSPLASQWETLTKLIPGLPGSTAATTGSASGKG